MAMGLLLLTLSFFTLPACSLAADLVVALGRSVPVPDTAEGLWASDDPEIANIGADGMLVAYAPGETSFRQLTDNEAVWAVEVSENSVPELVTSGIDIALSEWENSLGKSISRSNKYTKWYCGRKCEFGWCGAFIGYSLDKAGIPMDYWRKSMLQTDGHPHAVREADVLKLLRGYTNMDRIGRVPQPGYLVIYGKRGGYATIHVGLVTDAIRLGDGRYIIHTVEGNVSSRVKRYCYLYDAFSEDPQKNMSMLPNEEQTEPEVFQYTLHQNNWYVNVFCQTWY